LAAIPGTRFGSMKSPRSVNIVPYDPEWPIAFSTEFRRLAAALGTIAVRIDHHGSTAVPGLAAKPVIDIQVSVRELHPIEIYARRLEDLGYVHQPHPDDSFCPFFHRPAAWPHTHHVHVVVSGGAEERRTIAFRDYLCEHADLAREYEKLKRALAAHHSDADASAREAYAEAKTAFVTAVTQRALADGYPRGF
jgi:GrpB-like predicted nucleotidyltransferase (UPF0157 family)